MTGKKEQKIRVQAEPTPNPHSMKFKLNQRITEEHYETTGEVANPQAKVANRQAKVANLQAEVANRQTKVANPQAEVANRQTKVLRSPLAQKIMGFPWVDKVFIGPDFITINKQDWVEWDTLTEPLSDMIREHIETGQAVLSQTGTRQGLPFEKGATFDVFPPDRKDKEQKGHADSEIVQKIKQILEHDIQPAVAMDGGFISFEGYEKGRVFLKMQGACSGCPSSSITLKQGIEQHLKNQIPLVQEVVAL